MGTAVGQRPRMTPTLAPLPPTQMMAHCFHMTRISFVCKSVRWKGSAPGPAWFLPAISVQSPASYTATPVVLLAYRQRTTQLSTRGLGRSLLMANL